MRSLLVLLALLACAAAFVGPAGDPCVLLDSSSALLRSCLQLIAKPSTRGLNMIFGLPFGESKAASTPAAKSVAKAAAKTGPKIPTRPTGGYVPDGLTKEQWLAIDAEKAKAQEAKKAKLQKKKAEGVETLEEWQLKYENGGGHRVCKTKYDGWYSK